MCRTNQLKSLYGLFISICAMVVLSAFPSAAAGASLADLAGTWNFNSMVSGPDAPWWFRATTTVNPDGTFTGSGTESDGSVDHFAGAFSISTSGLVMSGVNPKTLCQIDLSKTVLVCTVSWPHQAGVAGSADLIVGTKQASSCSMDDLVGNWEGNSLDSGPTNPSWERIKDYTIDINGNFQGSYSVSSGATGGKAGQLALTTDGKITCQSGDCPDLNYTSFMNAGKTVMVGTYGATTQAEDAVLSVFTKKAASYSKADLVGIWKGNGLASGPAGSPFWGRPNVTVNADGTFRMSSTESDSPKIKTGTGTLSLSSDGVITCESGCGDPADFRMVMDANKTVLVGTQTWSDGSAEFYIFTKSAGLPDAPTGVSATAGNAQAKVTFTLPASNGSAITGYTVTSSPDATHPNGVTAKGKASPITVKGLSNGTPYTFTVTATNKIGTGAASTPSIQITPAKVPGAPTIGTITAGDRRVTVNFTEISDGGSAITGYKVTSIPGGITANGNASPITVQGLTNGTPYKFTVTATNGIGSTSSKPSKAITPATVPGQPTNVNATAGASGGTVVVAFKQPDSNGGSPITGYTVTSSAPDTSITINGKTSPITVTGLNSGTSYSFTVSAANSIGTGPDSSPSNPVTPAATPSVQGTWHVTGNSNASYTIQGVTQPISGPINETFIFSSNNSFQSTLWNGTWTQNGLKYTIDVRQSIVDYCVQTFADYGLVGTCELSTYNIGGTVSANKITLTAKIAGVVSVTSPPISATFSETDICSGGKSTAMTSGSFKDESTPQGLKRVINNIIQSIKANP